MPAPPSFDARPLVDPVDSKAVSTFVHEMRARRSGSKILTGNVILVCCMIILVPTGMLAVLVFLGSVNIESSTDRLTFLVVCLVVFLIIASMLVVVGVSWSILIRKSRVARYRLSRFATANGMTYEDEVKDPPLPGMIFSIGTSRKSARLVRGHSPRFVEFGNYQYQTGSGKNSTVHQWGYVAVKLDVPLPNIVLDALGNNGIGTNLPTSFQKKQRLSLEGDFNRFFTLYCPAGYDADALYLFTPDIMARFIDNVAQLDVEIVDDWMFLYTKGEASTLDAATWAWLFNAVGALITKVDQWARWRDDRLLQEHAGTHTQAFATLAAPTAGQTVPAMSGAHALPFTPPVGMLRPPPGVAHEGRRLDRGMRWIPIVLVTVSILSVGIGWFCLATLS
ncbi:MAG: hypothetical protein ACTH8F_03250 [Microbacterium sp.]|uniref:hypothetical protein n=1 Tax=Microbacterium sp. TaxID=51671 RepID=UPI003F9AAE05